MRDFGAIYTHTYTALVMLMLRCRLVASPYFSSSETKQPIDMQLGVSPNTYNLGVQLWKELYPQEHGYADSIPLTH